MFLKIFLFVSVVCLANQSVLAATDKVVCYYASWAIYRPGNGKFEPEDIDPNLCTHVNYAFLGVEEDGQLQILDPENDINREGLKRVSALKKINPNLKCILSVGGWNFGSAIFSAVSADPEKRATMAKSCIEFFEEYGYDGLDIDWEYPPGADKENYISLMQTLKDAFEPSGYLLTVAVSSLPTDGGYGYDVPAMSKVIDIINLMTYDFHSSWGVTAQNSPLYASPSEGEWQKHNLNCNASITQWIANGADPQKLTIGMGFYGRTFNLTDNNNHGLGAPTDGAAPPGDYTHNQGTLGYNELCEFHPNATIEWDDDQKVPFLYDGNLWSGFDNPRSVKEKAQYAIDMNLAGVMMWTVETDDTHGFCGEKNGLLKAINEIL